MTAALMDSHGLRMAESRFASASDGLPAESAADNGRRARVEQRAYGNAVAIIALTKGLTAASCAAG